MCTKQFTTDYILFSIVVKQEDGVNVEVVLKFMNRVVFKKTLKEAIK